MAIKTGLDILLSATDQASGPLSRVATQLDTLEKKGSGGGFLSSSKGLTQAANAIKGGAALAGVIMMGDKIAAALEGTVKLRDQMARVNVGAFDVARTVGGWVPILGQAWEIGHRMGDAIVELWTGQEAAARAAREYAEQIHLTNELLFKTTDLYRDQVFETSRKADATQREIEMLERILELGLGSEESERRRFEAAEQIAKLEREHAEALEKLLNARLEATIAIVNAGGDIEGVEARTLDLLADLEEMQQREIERLRQKLELEDKIAERKRQEKEEAKRAAEAEKYLRDAERESEEKAREAEKQLEEEKRERERAAAEEKQKQDRIRDAAGNLTGFKEARGITGVAESFRARDGANSEAVNIARQQRGLLSEILRELKDQETPMIFNG